MADSLRAFGVYASLIRHESPTRIGTDACVNPLVAVIPGYCFGGELLDARTVLGSVRVIMSVVIIITGRTRTMRAPLHCELGVERP